MKARSLLILALAALMAVAPGAVIAQDITGPIGPGGIIYRTTAAVGASGAVTSAQTIFSKSVSSALFQTQPLHLAMKGTLSTASGSAGTLTVACSVGGVSITLVSAQSLTTSLTAVPIYIDLYVAPISSSAVAKNITGEVRYIATSTTYVGAMANAQGSVGSGVSQTISCTATFSVTTSPTGMSINETVLAIAP